MTWRQLFARAWRIFWRWYWRPRRLARIERLEISLGMRVEQSPPSFLTMPSGAVWSVPPEQMMSAKYREMNRWSLWNQTVNEMKLALAEVQPEPLNPAPFVLAAMVDHDEMERQHKTAREVRALQRIADANKRLRPSSPSATKTREPAGVR